MSWDMTIQELAEKQYKEIRMDLMHGFMCFSGDTFGGLRAILYHFCIILV